jgi:arylformamidase
MGAPEAPVIFLDYDEAGLDAAYDQTAWADNIDDVVARILARDAEAKSALDAPVRYSFGSSEIEGLDWYSPGGDGGPVHVHFYGGAWRSGESVGNAYIADLSLEVGAHCVIPDYVKVGDTNGDLMPLGEQCRRAVAWVYSNAERLGADPERIVVSGHSAGAHLAGVVLTTDWAEYGLPADVVKKGLCVSGMFDLYPVSLSSRNEYVAFTDQAVDALSPIRHLDLVQAEVVVAAGTRESPEFQRQSREFHAALEAEGKQTSLLMAEGLNHFEILLDLGTHGGVVRQALTRLINEA